MSFFGKLRDRLFKSSKKLEEGLDAIVDDGGVVETAEDEAAQEQADDSKQAVEAAAAEAAAEQQALEQAAAAAEARAASEAAQARAETEAAAQQAERERLEREAAEQARRAQEARDAQDAAEAARERAAAEAARATERAQQQADKDALREQARQQALQEAEAQAKARAKAEAQAQAEAAAAQAAAAAETARRQAAQEAQAAQDRARKAAAEAEAQRQAEAARDLARQEAEQRADEARQAAQAQQKAAELAAAAEQVTPAEDKPGLIGRLLGRGRAQPVMRRALDDDMLESLEELLITSDMGVDTALRVVANIAEGRMGRKMSSAELKTLLADEVTRIMENVAKPLPLYAKTPQIVLVVGVNGSGKTTTIGKLASQFRAAGKSVMIAAGDTFRAAAVEQLQVWGERAGVPVMTAPEGSDPASLAFDAIEKAQAEGVDLLMIDTAGRLQNRADLMEELAKIVRVIKRKDETAPHNTLLVLDATTGQNALNQVEIFRDLAEVSGLVMTKLDGTAKGGVLVALADKFGLPIHAIGVGEKIDDLDAFDARDFALALTGAEG